MEYCGVKFKDKGIPVKMSATPGRVRRMPPKKGEPTDEVRKSLGFTHEQLSTQREEGAIF